MRKKIIATGGIVTTLLIAGASTTFAHSGINKQRPHVAPKLEQIAAQYGLNVEEIKEELKLGKTPRQILEEQGMTQEEIKQIFKYRKFKAGDRNLLLQKMQKTRMGRVHE
jgi:hypothetical protein